MRVLPLSVLMAAIAIPGAGCVDLYRNLPPDDGGVGDGGLSDVTTTDGAGDDATDDAADANAVLWISEVRSAGPAGMGFGDDFVEIYNPSATQSVTLTPSWKIMQQSAQGAACQGAPKTNFVGDGKAVIPPHGHFLVVGWEYVQMPPGDAKLLLSDMNASIADAASIWLQHGSKVVDAICFYYDNTNLGYLNMACPFPYECKGMPVSNLPHNGSSQPTSLVDASLERKPGGAQGNTQNTGDNSADFRMIMPANPENLHSPPVP